MSKTKIYLEWDVHNWSKALPLWEEALQGKPYKTALELGSRNGGLSLWLAENYGLYTVCSDLVSPEVSARKIHARFPVNELISYRAIDMLKIDFKDNSFDIIIFKSVLGALRTFENQAIAMNEIYRVLKPGGVLLFAENLKSSCLHIFARKLFVKWAKHWRYLHISEMSSLMKVYKYSKLQTAGFTTILLPGKVKSLGFKMDDLLDKNNVIPGLKYIVFGYGVK